MPTAEVEVPTDLVRRLLAAQHLPHEELTEGDGAFHQAARRPTRADRCGAISQIGSDHVVFFRGIDLPHSSCPALAG